MIKSHFSNEKGFTLLEILIAITILSVGLLALAEMTVYVIRSNAVGNKITKATVLAQDKLEGIKRLGYSGISATDNTVTEAYNSIYADINANGSYDSGIDVNYYGYKRETSIQVYPTNPIKDTKKVTVKVYWDSDNRSVSLSTMIGK